MYICLGEEFVNFGSDSKDDPSHSLYKMISKPYFIDEKFGGNFRSNVIVSNKVVAFVPETCYCCDNKVE